MLATPQAQAADAADAAQRIETIFELVLQNPSQPADPFIVHAMERSAKAREAHAAASPDNGDVPFLTAFREGPSASLETGVFSRVLAPTDIIAARLPRPRPDAPQIEAEPAVTGSIAPAAARQSGPALEEASYFDRFAGSFSGSGEVKHDARSNANHVTCDLKGQALANGVSISGKCGVSFISREVRADIRYDPGSGTYTGTYIGSDAGPARLWGKRRGDQVVLTITWPKPVNGDTKATMTIHNSGNGSFAISVVDAVQPGGPQAEVTRLALSQS